MNEEFLEAENKLRIRNEDARQTLILKQRESSRNYRRSPGSKEKLREAQRKHFATPDGTRVRRARLLRKTYGITIEQWEEMFDSQGRVCAICKSDNSTSKKGWSTDHCHSTGKVRGILCNLCNVALGLVKDNPETLLSAMIYLMTPR